MNKVVTINLNGNAYQLEEAGFEALHRYLEQAGHKLKENPDKEEVMADLEQAIADKCQRYLSPRKSVLLATEVEAIIAQMGPVAAEGEEEGPAKDGEGAAGGPPKRLYKIKEGAVLDGVCTGLAAYFGLDVVIVRILFVLFTLVSHGFGILVYIVMAVIVPPARTAEDKAAARGLPFNAQEVIDRARQKYEEISKDPHWHEQWEEKWRAGQAKWEQKWQQYRWEDQWRDQWAWMEGERGGLASVIVRVILFFTLTWLWIAAVWSIFWTGAIFGWTFGIAHAWVLWGLVTAVVYLLFWPVKASLVSRYYRHGGHRFFGWICWVLALSACLFIAFRHEPQLAGVNAQLHRQIERVHITVDQN